MEGDALLGKFKEAGALLEGHFLLRSGLHSRQFFQCAQLLKYPELCSEICAALAKKCEEIEADAVISPALGGILVGHEVARHLSRPHIFAEKKGGALVMRRFEIPEFARYLVAEDVVTTGSAVKEVCHIVRHGGAEVAGVASIVDRSGNNPPDFEAPFISLLKMKVETFQPDELPDDLKSVPAVKPGSR
ncbi:MAG: orotate phosphoribosyltransferase [Verrucomicrobiota bacterium]